MSVTIAPPVPVPTTLTVGTLVPQLETLSTIPSAPVQVRPLTSFGALTTTSPTVQLSTDAAIKAASVTNKLVLNYRKNLSAAKSALLANHSVHVYSPSLDTGYTLATFLAGTDDILLLPAYVDKATATAVHTWIQQNANAIKAQNAAQNTDRFFVTVKDKFRRALGLPTIYSKLGLVLDTLDAATLSKDVQSVIAFVQKYEPELAADAHALIQLVTKASSCLRTVITLGASKSA